MPHYMQMEVGGISFGLTSPLPLSSRGTGRSYRPFLGKAGNTRPSIRIEIVPSMEDAPSTAALKQIFSSRSWAMYRSGDDYLIEFHGGGRGALWRVRAASDFSRATVYCGGPLAAGRPGGTIVNPLCYPLDQIILIHALARRGGVIVHAAGAAVHGAGCIFPGRSGAGKSTLVKHLLAADAVRVFSDDRVVLRRRGDGFTLYGTPWPGDAHIARNESAPLENIFFITHGRVNRIDRMEEKEALERILPVTSVPWYEEGTVVPVLSTLESIVSRVPSYLFSFTPGAEVADVLERFIAVS